MDIPKEIEDALFDEQIYVPIELPPLCYTIHFQ